MPQYRAGEPVPAFSALARAAGLIGMPTADSVDKWALVPVGMIPSAVTAPLVQGQAGMPRVVVLARLGLAPAGKPSSAALALLVPVAAAVVVARPQALPVGGR